MSIFKTKQVQVPGACFANRCKNAPAPGGLRSDLCAQHYNEWVAAGNPALEATGPRKAGDKAPKPPKDDAALETLKTELAPVRDNLARALQFVTSVPADAVLPIGFLGRTEPTTGLQALGLCRETARVQLKNLEERRTSQNRPLLDKKRRNDELFKPYTETCEAIVDACTSRLEAYEKARLAAQREAAALVHAAPTDPSVLAVAHGAAEALPAQVRAQPVWRIKVVDFALVPDALKLFNQQAAQLLVDSKRGQIVIPGLEITEDVEIKTNSANARKEGTE